MTALERLYHKLMHMRITAKPYSHTNRPNQCAARSLNQCTVPRCMQRNVRTLGGDGWSRVDRAIYHR